MVGRGMKKLGGASALKGLDNAASGLCFTKGTLVYTKTGLRPIEEIQEGDLVASQNEYTGETEWKPVVHLFHNKDKEVYKLTLVNQSKEEALGVTGEHPFFIVGKGWVEAQYLQQGDEIVSLFNSSVEVKSLELQEEKEDTYNFEVAYFHTYYVGETSVLVHNSCAMGVDKHIRTNVKDTEAWNFIDSFLGNDKQTNMNPFKAVTDSDRIFVEQIDGSFRSLRFGSHEMSKPAGKGMHFHLETWTQNGAIVRPDQSVNILKTKGK